jgi:dephospho-CoA kinase
MKHGKRIVIGVGGNVGTGKTTVCKFFESLGAYYISADEIGWEVLPEMSHALEEKFGNIIMYEGMIDKKKLRDIVFSKRENLEYLNKLSHPRIIQKILQRIEESTSEMIVIDAALLFDWPEICEKIDYSILVTAAESIKAKRSTAKRIDSDLFKKIISFQKNDAEISGQVNFIIKNDGTMNVLKKQCRDIYEEIKNDC